MKTYPLLFVMLSGLVVGCAPMQFRVTSDIPGVAGPVANFASKYLPVDGCPPGTRAQVLGNAYGYIHNNYGYYNYGRYYSFAPVLTEVFDYGIICMPQSYGYRP